MPLMPDPSGDFRVERYIGVKFAMFDGEKRVLCTASWEVLQDRAALDHADQDDVGAIFKKHRTAIETVATAHCDGGETNPVVRTGQF